MGVYMMRVRPGRVLEASRGRRRAGAARGRRPARWVDEQPRRCGAFFDLDKKTLALALIVYGFVASVLPVWLLLAPRDYLSAFVKLGTVALLAVGLADRAARRCSCRR